MNEKIHMQRIVRYYKVICNGKVNKSNKWLMSWGSWNVLDMLDFWLLDFRIFP